MASSEERPPEVGEMVVLVGVPPRLLDNLPQSDQTAICDAVGKPMLLEAYDEGWEG